MNGRKNILLFVSLILSACLVIAAIVVAIVFNINKVEKYSYERKTSFEVATATQLKDGKKFSYEDIVITNDLTIDLTTVTLSTMEYPFMGTFDGNGKNITLVAGEKATPLFEALGESAVIKNVNFVVDNLSSKTTPFSLIAGNNYGVIENCSIKVRTGTVGEGRVALVSAVNKGTIRNLYIQSTLNITGGDDSLFGNISLANYGTIKNCVVKTQLDGDITDNAKRRTGEVNNNTVSALRIFDCNEGVVENNLVIMADKYYTSDKGQKGITFATAFDSVNFFRAYGFGINWEYVKSDDFYYVKGGK